MADHPSSQAMGPNAWLVDEMYERYVADPESVGDSWRDFFSDYTPTLPVGPAAAPNGQTAANGASAPAAPAPNGTTA
ncbi:MAG: hypothetical protein S0880_12585, partial [Actinomycetota bacterium]|nr:hypothetical protein [Actinomycetota bacterium]